MMEKLKKYTGIIILVSISIIILIVYQIAGSGKAPTPSISPSPSPTGVVPFIPNTQSNYKLPVYSQPTPGTNGQIDLNSTKVKTAISEKQNLTPQLPIYVEGFQTTAGITTTLNVYTIPEDPDYQIHIEIYGINYGDDSILTDGNKNAQAFVESFNKIKALLNADGADIHNFYFIAGTRPYVQSAADSLIKKYNLL